MGSVVSLLRAILAADAIESRIQAGVAVDALDHDEINRHDLQLLIDVADTICRCREKK